MAKKKQHGGRREGAGRKPTNPEGRTVTLTASVPGELVTRLDAMAEANDWSRSQAVTEAIRALLAAKRNP
jgi:hypothetical protein